MKTPTRSLSKLIFIVMLWPGMGLLTATAQADTVTLEELCGDPYATWDAATSTCTTDDSEFLRSKEELIVIARGETLVLSSFLAYVGTILNMGTLIIGNDDTTAAAYISGLINSGVVSMDAYGLYSYALVGDGNNVPSINAGTIVIGPDTQFVFAPAYGASLDNVGRIENNGTLEIGSVVENRGQIENNGSMSNYSVIENRDQIDNRHGELYNAATGVINNYRCPGNPGVVTSGASNITNDGEINFVNASGC